MLESLASTPAESLTSEAGDELWDLILEASRLDEITEQAVRTLELSVLAKYAFGLAQRFNGLLPQQPGHRGRERGRPTLAGGGCPLFPIADDPRPGADGV